MSLIGDGPGPQVRIECRAESGSRDFDPAEVAQLAELRRGLDAHPKVALTITPPDRFDCSHPTGRHALEWDGCRQRQSTKVEPHLRAGRPGQLREGRRDPTAERREPAVDRWRDEGQAVVEIAESPERRRGEHQVIGDDRQGPVPAEQHDVVLAQSRAAQLEQQLTPRHQPANGSDRPLVTLRLDHRVETALEDLWRLAIEGAGSEGGTSGHHAGLRAFGDGRQDDGGREPRPGPIADQLDQPAEGGPTHRRAQIGLVRDAFFVEGQDVQNVGPHLHQHDATVVSFPGAPIGQRRVDGNFAQHRAPELRKTGELARQRGQPRRDVRLRRMDQRIARAADLCGVHG